MNKEKIRKSIYPPHRPSPEEWMKEFKVSSQYYELQVLELVLRDEVIFEKRSNTNNKTNKHGQS
jgi:hypothetical protein